MSVFFSSQKTVLKSWLDTSSIASYLSSFLSFFLLQSWQHLDILLLVFLFLDSFSTHYLLMLIFLDTCSIDVSTPPRHLICRDLLMVYIFSSCDPQLTSVYLSLDTSVFSPPKPLSLTPNLFPWDSQPFSSFSSLGKLLISLHLHAFHVLKPRILGFFVKFWGFSKLKSYC